MLVAGLEGVDDAQDFSSVTSSAGWVGEDGANGLLGIDNEYRPDGESDALLVDIGGILVIDPTTESTDGIRHKKRK
jgi:hypothetical protein